MKQLSNMDASFLNLETATTPMHIGCILRFSPPKEGNMYFERLKHHVISRLPSSPVFRRKLSRLPFDLDRPYWVEDKKFNIDNHLHHVQLEGLQEANQRKAIIDAFFSRPMDLSIPLWELMYIESSQIDSDFTLLLKLHHSAADGMSGEKMLTGLLSTEADIDYTDEQDDWTPEHPSYIQMAGNKLLSIMNSRRNLSRLGYQFSKALHQSQQLRDRESQPPPSFFQSPATLFNGDAEQQKTLNSAHLSLDAIKAIKNRFPGCTINDVVLAICAGALRTHLKESNALPNAPLIAMAPVSKRRGTEQDQGNLISAMLISLATDIDDPVARLLAIQANAKKAKEYNQEVALEKVMDVLPPIPSSLVLKTYSRLRLARFLKPVFNLVITNVPGSRVPLYLNGAELKSLEGMAPIVDSMGLMLVVTSYVDTLTIGITCSQSQSSRMLSFTNALHDALKELYQTTSEINASKMRAA